RNSIARPEPSCAACSRIAPGIVSSRLVRRSCSDGGSLGEGGSGEAAPADVLAGAVAGIDVVRRCERGQRVRIRGVVFALAAKRIQALVGNKSEPRQVLEDGGL